MSKFSKLKNHPRQFFADAWKKQLLRVALTIDPKDFDRLVSKIQSEVTTKVRISSEKDKKRVVTKTNRLADIELAKKLQHLESNSPVAEFKFEDGETELQIWPLLRHLLWVRCQGKFRGKNVSSINTYKMHITESWHKHYRAISNATVIEEVDPEPCDFLFFTNLRGTEQTTVGGKIFNRITDPVYEIASRIGITKKVEIIKSTGHLGQDRFHDVRYILPPLTRRIGRANMMPNSKEIISYISKYLPETDFSDRSLRELMEWFFAQYDFYLQVLSKFNPKVVFFVGFDYHYSLILAAKTLGIHTVDLQHGVQAGWSPVYNQWQIVPKTGYKLFPDTFWVWGNYDANKIRSSSYGQFVTARVGGFPWLDRQTEFFDRITRESIPEIPAEKKVCLLTLQDQPMFPSLFEKIIKNTSNEICWIVKRHPKHQKMDLSKIRNMAIVSKELDDANIYSLLNFVDLHLTECSTTVIDADYFGVPSIVSGEQGKQNFGEFLQCGSVAHIEEAEEFDNLFEVLTAEKRESRMDFVDNENSESVLRELLENANE